MRGRTGYLWAGLLPAFLAFASGCGLVRRGPEAMVDALLQQSDPVLVEAGLPAYLLLLDAMVEASPKNRKYLLAATDANSAYAAAFLTQVEPDRARDMYKKARDYGLRVLRRNRRFRAVENRRLAAFETAIPSFRRKDVPALYATAMAWIGWIINNPGSIEATSELPKALALMNRVLELHPGYENGGPEMLYGIYYCVQPRGAGQDLEKAKRYFLKAMEYAGPDSLLPRVAYAEFYARYAYDETLFEQILTEVLKQECESPRFRLMNAISKKRAEALLEEMDDLF